MSISFASYANDEKYIGTDANGKSCSLEIKSSYYNVEIASQTLDFMPNSQSTENCNLYTNTPEKILIRNLEWNETGRVIQLTIDLKENSYLLEEGPSTFFRSLACLKFEISHKSTTCSHLVLQ